MNNSRSSVSLQHIEQQLLAHKNVAGETKSATLLQPIRKTRDLERRRIYQSKKLTVCTSKVKGKMVDPKEVKPLVRKRDQMTCMRAPIEPLSPKSPEVMDQLKPLRQPQGRYPDRWYKKKSTVQEILANAKLEAIQREKSKMYVGEWNDEKGSLKRLEKKEKRRFVRLEKLRVQDRKKNCDLNYKLWMAKKRLHDFKESFMITSEPVKKVKKKQKPLSKKNKMILRRLQLKVIEAERDLLVQLRNQKELQALEAEEQKLLENLEHDPSSSGGDGDDMKAILKQKHSPMQLVCAEMKLLLDEDKSRLKDAFEKIDTSKDGTISKLEFAALAGSLKLNLTSDEAMKVFEEIDSDNSNELSYQELYRVVRTVDDDVVKNVLRLRKKLERKAKEERKRFYATFKEKLPTRVYARLKNPALYIAMHTWKRAFREGMNVDAIRNVVEASKIINDTMEKLRLAMNENKAKFISMFREFDKSGDGTVDAKELSEVLRQLGVESTSCLQSAKMIIKRLDKDRDGTLHYFELMRAFRGQERERKERKLHRQATKATKEALTQMELAKQKKVEFLRKSRPTTSELEDVESKLEKLTETVQNDEKTMPIKASSKVPKQLKESPLKQPKVKLKVEKNKKKKKSSNGKKRYCCSVQDTEFQNPGTLLKEALTNYAAFAQKFGHLNPRVYVAMKEGPNLAITGEALVKF